MEDVRKLENNNVVEVVLDVESVSGCGRCSHGRGSHGRGYTRGVKQRGGNDSGGVAEGST